MKLSQKFSIKISDYIKRTLNDKTDEDLEIIRYGLEVLFMNFTKFPIILAVGYLLGMFKYTFYTLVIFSAIRYFAAGVHARKSYTCLISTLIIILGATYLSLKFTINFITKTLIFIVVISVFFKYAPADTEEKPYLNPLVRKQLKVKSLVIAMIYFTFSISLNKVFFSDIFIHVLWIECILISPITYRILKRRYNNYEYYKEAI